MAGAEADDDIGHGHAGGAGCGENLLGIGYGIGGGKVANNIGLKIHHQQGGTSFGHRVLPL